MRVHYAHYNLYTLGVVFPLFGWLSFLFLGEFEGNTNIDVAIKSGSTIDADREGKMVDSRSKLTTR